MLFYSDLYTRVCMYMYICAYIYIYRCVCIYIYILRGALHPAALISRECGPALSRISYHAGVTSQAAFARRKLLLPLRVRNYTNVEYVGFLHEESCLWSCMDTFSLDA